MNVKRIFYSEQNIILFYWKYYVDIYIYIYNIYIEYYIKTTLSLLKCFIMSERTVIPVGINENRHLTESSSNCNRKAITAGTNICSIGLNNQWKLNKTNFYIYIRCGKPITHEENTNFMNFL